MSCSFIIGEDLLLVFIFTFLLMNNCRDMTICLYKVFPLDSYWLILRLPPLLLLLPVNVRVKILQAEKERLQIEILRIEHNV